MVHEMLLVLGAGLLAGCMNAVAGGGSFVSLPALLAAGLPALNANATSTVALVPSALASAYAYRKDFSGFEGVRLWAMAALSVVGGALGALLLMATPQQVFEALVPYLLLFGTLAFAFGRQAGAYLRARLKVTPRALLLAQFVLGLYGGYFGGAVGVMMLATWSLMTSATLATMQASRNLLNTAMNATAALFFIAGGLIYWRQAVALLAGAVVGGYLAAFFARRIDPRQARIVISCLNVLMTALVFWRAYR